MNNYFLNSLLESQEVNLCYMGNIDSCNQLKLLDEKISNFKLDTYENLVGYMIKSKINLTSIRDGQKYPNYDLIVLDDPKEQECIIWEWNSIQNMARKVSEANGKIVIAGYTYRLFKNTQVIKMLKLKAFESGKEFFEEEIPVVSDNAYSLMNIICEETSNMSIGKTKSV